MVNLNKDTVIIFSSSIDLFLGYQKLMFNLRVLTINTFKNYNVNSYAAFESFVLSLFPYEDKDELSRFWSGNFPSEFIIDKMVSITSFLDKVEITKYQSFPNKLETIYYKSISI